MDGVVLTFREIVALKEIHKYRGRYSIFWTPKTREKLEAKGLVRVNGDHVELTGKGRDWIDA